MDIIIYVTLMKIKKGGEAGFFGNECVSFKLSLCFRLTFATFYGYV